MDHLQLTAFVPVQSDLMTGIVECSKLSTLTGKEIALKVTFKGTDHHFTMRPESKPLDAYNMCRLEMENYELKKQLKQ